jgi:uncharacterized protein (TIGR02996 family)
LLAAIAAEPETIGNWIVYADWLSDRGDPRGELIAIELAIEAGLANDEARERHRLLTRDEQQLLSPRLDAESHHLKLQFWRGFITKAQVFGPADDLPTKEVLEALVADPHACVLHRLDLGPHGELAGDLCFASVRELWLRGAATKEVALEDGFPRLGRLALEPEDLFDVDDAQGAGLERLAHSRLVTLDGVCPALRTGAFALPSLEGFECGRVPIELFDSGGLLTAPPPRLARLTCPASADFVRALRASPLVTQLQRLVINIDDDATSIDELVRERRLARIELAIYGHLDTRVERDAVQARILAAFPRAELKIFAGDEPPESVEPEPIAAVPEAAKGIADAIQRLVGRMREKK